MHINTINNLNFYKNTKYLPSKKALSNYKNHSKEGQASSLECLAALNQSFLGIKKPKIFDDKITAQEYFLNKYGIIAEFKDIEQANLLKEAVDEVIKTNFQNKQDKLFEGLKVGNKFNSSEMFYAGLYKKLKFPMPDYELTNQKALKYIKTLNEEDIGYEYLEINFNTNCDIDGFYSKIKNNNGKYAFTDLKFALVHELAHWLYAKYSPKDFAIGDIIQPMFNPGLENEKEVISQVSKYATLNINEFIAEYIAGRLQGKVYPKEVDELYKKYNGVALFD